MGFAPVRRSREENARLNTIVYGQSLDELETERLTHLLVGVEMMGLVHDQHVPGGCAQKPFVPPRTVHAHGRQGSNDLIVGAPEIGLGPVHLRAIHRHADIEK